MLVVKIELVTRRKWLIIVVGRLTLFPVSVHLHKFFGLSALPATFFAINRRFGSRCIVHNLDPSQVLIIVVLVGIALKLPQLTKNVFLLLAHNLSDYLLRKEDFQLIFRVWATFKGAHDWLAIINFRGWLLIHCTPCRRFYVASNLYRLYYLLELIVSQWHLLKSPITKLPPLSIFDRYRLAFSHEQIRIENRIVKVLELHDTPFEWTID
jgi:hypothetical protein